MVRVSNQNIERVIEALDLERLKRLRRFKSSKRISQELVDELAVLLVSKAFSEDAYSAKRAKDLAFKEEFESGPRKRYRFARFCVIYESLKGFFENGEWPSQTSIAEEVWVSQASVSRFLTQAGFKQRLFKAFDGGVNEELIVRGYRGGISTSSLISFLGFDVSSRSLYRSLKRRNVRSDKKLAVVYGDALIPLHKAADFYEAVDAEFSFEESVEYAGFYHNNVGKYLLENRESCEEVVIGALRLLFDESEHDKPYVTDALRDKVRDEVWITNIVS